MATTKPLFAEVSDIDPWVSKKALQCCLQLIYIDTPNCYQSHSILHPTTQPSRKTRKGKKTSRSCAATSSIFTRTSTLRGGDSLFLRTFGNDYQYSTFPFDETPWIPKVI